MTHRLYIGLDFDDTLLPMRERVAELLHAQFGKPCEPVADSEFRASGRWGLSKEQFLAWFAQHQEELHEIEPYPGVRRTLLAWSKFASLRIITGRRADVLEHVALWVKRHGLPIGQIHSAPSAGEKVACALAHGVNWFVEDHDGTARMMVEAGINVVLLDKPYNAPFFFVRLRHARDWGEVGERVECHRAVDKP